MEIAGYSVAPKNIYSKPTPKIAIMIGDGLVMISDILVITGVVSVQPWLSIIALVAGRVGKYICKCFAVPE
jgi:hypothetical protein